MWPGSSVLIVISVLIFSVHSLPYFSHIDWRNDPNTVTQNEKILKLFLKLATHTANRLTHLRKKFEKEYDCRRNDNPSVLTTETLTTQSSSQTNLEWLDESQKILNHSSSSDSEISSDQNQTDDLQLQVLSNLQNIDDVERDIERNLNSKVSNLTSKSVQDIHDTSTNVTGRNDHDALDFDTLQKPTNEEANQTDLLQEPTLEISQRLFGTDLAQIVPKIISDVHQNVDQHIAKTQNTQKPLEAGVKRFFNILSSTKNILESIIKVLSEAAKGANNLLHLIIPQSQDTNSNNIQQEQSKSDSAGETANASGTNNQETRNNQEN
ncbi:PREDICTED: uncharacterized protein LOC105450023 isoform X1 [Wasmannia auropunctata]|uniref:uncharacterized protein LOC105450023 isoform X1 n=1 Tax=Wasmannia auropunctata TaxID=64793 RepID=UPI0005EE6AEE|nr:PREDICTED: uncharacterized protein LOC105450023 isoform X1 [Wasmannia auropunctata]